MALAILLDDRDVPKEGVGEYRLIASGGEIVLPGLVLRPTGTRIWLYELHVDITGVNEATAERIRAAWLVSSRELTSEVVIPGRRVELPGLTAPATATISIAGRYRDSELSGQWVAYDTKASLSFTLHLVPDVVASEEEPAPGSQRRQEKADSDREWHHGVVAVDFGTTASTVTLWDQWQFLVPVLPGSQATVLCNEVVALLRAAPDRHAHASAEWDSLRADVVRRCLGVASGNDVEELVRTLRREQDPNTPVLHAVLHSFDTRLLSCSEVLAEWMAERLDHAYSEAFHTPAPDRWHLHRVPLAPDGQMIIDTTVKVSTGSGGLDVSLGPPPTDLSQNGNEPLVLTGLKRHFGRSAAEALKTRDIDTDKVIAAAIASLVAKADGFTSRSDNMDKRPINNVVVTYPTAMPGSVRRQLRDMVGEAAGVTGVTVAYDEAVAAAFFFLMRELGSLLEIGVEAMRARMRPTVNDGVYTGNVLVVDIGGGTCDIALFTFNLHDVSPVVPNFDKKMLGKMYRVVPTLRGTNGREHRGGDFLTLCVFHWLKARLADYLLTTPDLWPNGSGWIKEAVRRFDKNSEIWADDRYRPGSLVKEELGYLTSGGGWSTTASGKRAHREQVELVVPTRWKERPASRATFTLLWSMADKAKKDYLGVGKPFEVSMERLEPVLRSIAQSTAPAESQAGRPVAFTLEPHTFETIARPALVRLARLAVGLVRSRFGGQPQPLDRLILTGRASRMPLVEKVVGEEFAKAAAADSLIEWSPAALVVDTRSAKSATSMGAAWIERMRKLGVHQKDAVAVVTEGITEIDVDVNNIFQTLPATFQLTKQQSQQTVLRANEPFDEVSPSGTARREVYLGALQPQMIVNRIVEGDDELKQWGSYEFVHTAEKTGYQPALDARDSHSGAGDRSGRDWLAGIRTSLEINHILELTLHLWRDRRPEATAGPPPTPTFVVPESEGIPLGDGSARPSDLPAVAARLVVRTGSGDAEVRSRVFRRNGTVPDRVELTDEFAASSSLTSARRPGILSTAPIPPPGPGGWTFYLLEGNNRRAVGQLAGSESSMGWYASLDAVGVLRVHHGKPSYLRADDFAQMDQYAGAVFSTPMTASASEDQHSDPHNGLQ